MPPFLRAAFSLASLSALIASTTLVMADEPTEIFRAFAGEPYRGHVMVRIIDPAAPDRPLRRQRGEAAAHFTEEEEGVFTLALTGSIEAEGDAAFVVSGKVDETGWRNANETVSLSISLDGVIEGGGVEEGQSLRFTGQAAQNAFTFEARTEMLEDTDGGFPAGTLFIFSYTLSRASPGAAAEDAESECRNIQWQSRNIATFSGSMTLIQVPVCVN